MSHPSAEAFIALVFIDVSINVSAFNIMSIVISFVLNRTSFCFRPLLQLTFCFSLLGASDVYRTIFLTISHLSAPSTFSFRALRGLQFARLLLNGPEKWFVRVCHGLIYMLCAITCSSQIASRARVKHDWSTHDHMRAVSDIYDICTTLSKETAFPSFQYTLVRE